MTPNQLKKLRIKLKLTQKQLAEKVGVSTRQIQYYEAGTHNIKGSVLIILKQLRGGAPIY